MKICNEPPSSWRSVHEGLSQTVDRHVPWPYHVMATPMEQAVKILAHEQIVRPFAWNMVTLCLQLEGFVDLRVVEASFNRACKVTKYVFLQTRWLCSDDLQACVKPQHEIAIANRSVMRSLCTFRATYAQLFCQGGSLCMQAIGYRKIRDAQVLLICPELTFHMTRAPHLKHGWSEKQRLSAGGTAGTATCPHQFCGRQTW